MKKLLRLALLVAIIFGTACEGPEGPEGPPGPAGDPGAQGPQGPAGEGTNATIFDAQWTFEPDEEGDYYVGIGFPENDIEVTETDVIMVYRMSFYDEENDVPIWSPLPQTLMGDAGTVQYSYSYSSLYMYIFINANFDLTEFAGVTDDQVFRTVIIPGQALDEGGRVSGTPHDLSNFSYQEIIKKFKISDKNVPVIKMK